MSEFRVSRDGNLTKTGSGLVGQGTDAAKQDWRQLVSLVESREWTRALAIANRYLSDTKFLNAKGVILMRMGRASDAVVLYRSFVLAPRCTWLRPDLPGWIKVNFATALMLDGHVAGCLDILNDLRRDALPQAAALRRCLKDWERQQRFWARWDWRLFGVTHGAAVVPIDFRPGQLEESDNPATVPPGPGIDLSGKPPQAA